MTDTLSKFEFEKKIFLEVGIDTASAGLLKSDLCKPGGCRRNKIPARTVTLEQRDRTKRHIRSFNRKPTFFGPAFVLVSIVLFKFYL